MINVSDTIKNLINTDSVRKNFRVHFPNGERADLTNADIVSESVTFNESICTNDTFCFGSTEQSSIEFETVGIENLNGMYIECSLEYSTETLADPTVGTLRSDIGGYWYAIPLGTFVVESSQRNHENMVHRKVVAYSDYSIDVKLGRQDAMLFNGSYGGNYPSVRSFNMNVWDFIVRNTGCEPLGYEEIETPYETAESIVLGEYYDNSATMSAQNRYRVIVRRKSVSLQYADGKKKAVRKSRKSTTSDYAIRTAITAALPDITYRAQDSSSFTYTREEVVESVMNNLSIDMFSTFKGTCDTFIASNDGAHGSVVEADEPYQIVVSHYTTELDTIEYKPYVLKCYEQSDTDNVLLNFTMKVKSTGKIASGSYSYIDALPETSEMISSYFEILGQYFKASRTGGSEAKSLDRENPIEINASQFSQAWLDEIEVSDIGIVKYAINDGEDVCTYSFGSGKSVYDMTNNAIIKNMTKQTDVNALLAAGFVERAGDVNFVPAEIVMRSMPYIEAGDALRIVMPDETEFITYVMNRSISGINYPCDTITSNQGVMTGDDEALYG